MQNSLRVPQHIVIATHTLFYGASDALRDYLISKKIESLLYIAHPLLTDNPDYRFEQYIFGKQNVSKRIKRNNAGSVYSYGIDLIRTILTGLSFNQKDILYIGINPVNAFAGLVLRAMGKVERVIFYGIDFTPKRYANPLLNYCYHALESYVVRHTDRCWNVSPKIAEGRQTYLDIDPGKYIQQVVPIGVWSADIVKNIKPANDHHLVFAGTLLKKQGVQMILEALPEVIHKIPGLKFTIIGGGEYDNELHNIARVLKLEPYVRFMGWVHDQEKIRQELIRSDIAVAVYVDEVDRDSNFTYYADPTKLKTYTSCGLPVIMTRVPYNAIDLEKNGAAILVEYTKDDVARALISLLTDKKKLLLAKERAREYIKTQTWERIFSEAFYTL